MLRDNNKWADFLSQVGLLHQRDMDLNEVRSMYQDDTLQLQPPEYLFVDDKGEPCFAFTTYPASAAPICDICGAVVKAANEARDCWGCSKVFHKLCLEAEAMPQRIGPWHCTTCHQHFKNNCVRDITLDEVKENIRLRDYNDTHRKENPLVKADDAIVLDNSHLTHEEQLNFVLELLH